MTFQESVLVGCGQEVEKDEASSKVQDAVKVGVIAENTTTENVYK